VTVERDIIKGEFGASYLIDPARPLESIDQHLADLRRNNLEMPAHPDFDLLLDARHVYERLTVSVSAIGACTEENPLCSYQEPHRHGFACDRSCLCRRELASSSYPATTP
jgi:hypothetical protein